MATDLETHPLVAYGTKRRWDYERTAKFFGVPYGVFKQMVRGFTGCSFQRAESFEKRSKGQVRAADVCSWHQRNNRRGSDERDGACA